MIRRLPFLLFLFAVSLLSARATDVQRFELLKGRHYYQVSESVSTIQTNNAYRFTAVAYATDLGDIVGAYVVTPKAGRLDLFPDNDGDPYEAKDKLDDQFHLDTTYPNGTYAFTIQTLRDGNRTMSFSITGDAYPNAPVLNNYTGLQNLAYNAYNVISWQPMAGGTEADFIQLKISDVDGNDVFETPDFGERGALNGIATKTILQPGTLKANALYYGTLHFGNVLQSASAAYPNTPGRAGYFARTEFTMRAYAKGLSPAIDKLQLWKTQRTEQFEDGAPFLQPKPYEFFAQLDAVSTNVLSAAILVSPANATNALDPNSVFDQFSFGDSSHTNLVEFNAVYGAGAYVTTAGHRDGTNERITATFAAGGFPQAPDITGAIELSNHRADQDLPVVWKPWTGAGESDFIRVELFDENGDKVWDTPGFTSGKHLRENATTVTIPAENFIPGRAYELQITFFHQTILDTQSLGGGILYAGYASRTKFQFATLPADALTYGIAQTQFTWQRSDTDYEPNSATPFLFEATALPSSPGALNGVQTTVPAHGAVALSVDPITGLFRFASTNSSASLLASSYPAGSYLFRFDAAHDGVRTAAVTLESVQLPPVPHVRNFAQLPILRANQDAEITWDAWAGFNPSTDKIAVMMFDVLGNPVDLSGQSVTEGSITNVAIFHDTLKPNQSYLVKLRFERKLPQIESTTYPGPRASGVLATETRFYASTLDRTKLIGAVVSKSSTILNASKQLQFFVTPAFTGRYYRLEATADFANWTTVQTNLVTGTALQFILPPTQPRASFRAVLLP